MRETTKTTTNYKRYEFVLGVHPEKRIQICKNHYIKENVYQIKTCYPYIWWSLLYSILMNKQLKLSRCRWKSVCWKISVVEVAFSLINQMQQFIFQPNKQVFNCHLFFTETSKNIFILFTDQI